MSARCNWVGINPLPLHVCRSSTRLLVYLFTRQLLYNFQKQNTVAMPIEHLSPSRGGEDGRGGLALAIATLPLPQSLPKGLGRDVR